MEEVETITNSSKQTEPLNVEFCKKCTLPTSYCVLLTCPSKHTNQTNQKAKIKINNIRSRNHDLREVVGVVESEAFKALQSKQLVTDMKKEFACPVKIEENRNLKKKVLKIYGSIEHEKILQFIKTRIFSS